MTAQIGEILIINGEETSMSFCPPIPEQHKFIKKLNVENDSFCTALWRGYIGTWEIKDNKFYLISVKSMNGKDLYEILAPIFADWFIGVLRINQGEIIHYVHMGFGSIFEKEMHVKIENGIVKRTRIIDNRNRKYKLDELPWKNLPGGENRFVGDDDF